MPDKFIKQVEIEIWGLIIIIKLQADADSFSFSKWCLLNGLCINVDKTNCMLITTRQRRTYTQDVSLQIVMNDKTIPACATQRLLGVNISQGLDWDDQVKGQATELQLNH